MVLQDVVVGWNGETIVSTLNFAVSRGEVVGLVGPSGSGKSTVASAILRLIPHEGTISIDGVSINQISDYQHHVTALLQTTYIFHTNVRENLRIANNAKTDAELLAALTQVGLKNWFEKLDDGFDSMIGDSDRGLSGGEIQRIGIARTILSGASFVLLDEPTEHLDSETAVEIWELVQRVFADKAVIVITHDQRITDYLRKTVFLV
jgi:ABC-type transport system involved in cytochrome bd biosynthesis fused ATPase/permease subunit